MILSNSLMPCTMKNVIDVLIANRTRIRIVNDYIFLGWIQVSMILHVKLGNVQGVLLARNVSLTIQGFSLFCM